MKRFLIKLIAIVIYLLILLFILDFNAILLLDIKSIFLVIFGTSLLTISNIKKDRKTKDILKTIPWNAQVTGYLTSLVLFFISFSNQSNTNNIMFETAMSLRPLLYSVIINILFKPENETDKTNGHKEIDEFIFDENLFNNIIHNLLNFGLTEREIEVVSCICKGMTNKEIANELFISEATVKKHSSNIFKKFEINNREQLKYEIHKRISCK